MLRPLQRLLALPAVLALLAGVSGGLARLGWHPLGEGVWQTQALTQHGALMIAGFFATVIGLERAVALRQTWAFTVPLLAGVAAVLVLLGATAAAAWSGLAAALLFVAVNGRIWQRQPEPHAVLLLLSSLCWLLGQLAWAWPGAGLAPVPWWFAFLVLTISAERLEMTRLMRREPGAHQQLFAAVLLLLVGAAGMPWVYGLGLLGLGLWLLRHDIARRTVRTQGLSRYMAVCLLAGHAWLVMAGLAWVAASIGLPTRDAALHALGLGFVFSMVMGHVPVILPAIAGVKLRYGPWFYLPLGLLQLSLLWRLGPGLLGFGPRSQGAALNAVALLAFVLTVLVSALLWRRLARPGEPSP